VLLVLVALAAAMPSAVVGGDEEYDMNTMDAEQDYTNWPAAAPAAPQQPRPAQFRTQQVSARKEIRERIGGRC
jgi:hypothetical protein